MSYMRDKVGRRLDSHSIRDVNPVYFLNVYENFFLSTVGGTQNYFVTSQATTATTLTAGVTAGASVLPVTSASGISAGVVLVTGAGTSTQQVHRVLSVASLNVTLTAPVTNALANGASVAPLWTNSTHLTTDAVGGTRAFGYFVANAKDSAGNYIINGAGKTVVWLGDSWTAQSIIEFNSELDTRLGATNVIDAGVAGNRLTAMLARFDTDVTPHDPDYVVIEFGVNDVADGSPPVTPTAMASQIQDVVARVRALGAVPIVTGMVPLADLPLPAQARQRDMKAMLDDGGTFPGLSSFGANTRLPAVRIGTSLGVGTGALEKVTTGDFNVAIGPFAGQNITTGTLNTIVGQSAGSSLIQAVGNTVVGSGALTANVGGASNTAVGNGALAAATGANSVAVGRNALLSLSANGDCTGLGFQAGRAATGASSTFVGYGAGYDPAGVAANASVAAIGQTVVGKQSGQGSATQRNYITCLGYQTIADGAGAVAIGTDSGGTGASATAANDFVLGTTSHMVKVPGKLQATQRTIATATDTGTTGEICWDANYVYVCTATNTWKRTAIATW